MSSKGEKLFAKWQNMLHNAKLALNIEENSDRTVSDLVLDFVKAAEQFQRWAENRVDGSGGCML